MTPEDRRQILSLVAVPGRQPEDHREDVLRHFGTADGKALGVTLLKDAVRRQDGVDVEMALIVSNVFGFTPDHLQSLVALASAGWHQKHEDVVTALGQVGTVAVLPALYEATQWIPDYLDFDDSRALARKAIWAIGNVPGQEAHDALAQLVQSDDEILREEAERQLKRR